MDCAPLNLAHFHERRAEKLMRKHRYDDAYKAVETSLLYLQDAYKNVSIAKSIEVLNTQRWDYERKLRQIMMRKQQHEKLKLKEIVPASENSSVVMARPEMATTAQSIAKSIDRTVEDFDAKFAQTLEQNMRRIQLNSKENQDPRLSVPYGEKEAVPKQPTIAAVDNEISSAGPTGAGEQRKSLLTEHNSHIEDDEMPSLAPLELPAFDYSLFVGTGSTKTFEK